MSHVFCKKAKLKFSSPGGTAQRPFLGRWLVLVDPNWFQQSRREVSWCRRTAASGTTEFQIRLNNQLQHKYTRINRHRKRPLRGTPAGLQVDAGLLSAAVRLARASGSSTEGSPRTRPEWRAICLYEAAAESTCRQYRVARWFLLPEAELRRGGASNRLQIWRRRLSSAAAGQATDCKYGN